jgi:uncharacterized membrane protein
MLAGIGILLFLLSGYLRLDIHGFGAVMLLTGIWYIVMGIVLWRTPATSGS